MESGGFKSGSELHARADAENARALELG